MSLFISNQTAGSLSIPDLGITLALGESYDLTQDRAVDIAISKNLPAQILAGNIAVLDPLDDVTPLSPAAGVEATGAMNDAHYRIRGGELNQLDDVDLTTTSPTTNDLLQFDGTDWVPIAFAGTQDLWETITSDAGSVAANSPTDTLTIAGGTGVSTAVSGDTLTITNDSPNVDQNIFETVAGDAGSATANTTTDTITIAGGTSISTVVVGDTLTIVNDDPNIVQNLWETIIGDAGSTSADSATDSLTIAGGTGIGTAVVGDTLTIVNSSPNVDQNLWETISSDAGSVAANTTTDTFTIAGGTGVSTAVVGDTLTITNDSPNVDQNLFLNVAGDSGTAVADNTTDTLTIAGGTGVSTAVSGDTLTITNDSPNVDQNIFQNVSDGTNTAVADTTTDTLTVTAGAGITAVITPASDTLTITNTSPNVDQDIFETVAGDTGSATANTTTDTITFAGGTGISTAVVGDTLTITNDSPNVDQNLFLNVASDSGTAVADNTTDTLTISGGTGISTAVAGDTLTITNDSPNVDQNLWATITADSGSATANTTTDSFDIGGTGNQISTSITADALSIALAPNTQIPGTEGIDIPSGTTAERPTTPTTGVMRFNTDTNLYEAWDGTQWVTFGAPAGSGVKEILFGQLAHLSGTTQTPADNTPPLVTEGSPFFSQEVTTQTDTGRIVIWFSSVATVSNANRTLTIAIYRDSTLVGVTAVSAPGSNAPQTTTFIVVDTPPAAGTYTYTGRIGLSAGGTWYIGGFTTNFNYGGAANTNNQYVLMRIE